MTSRLYVAKVGGGEIELTGFTGLKGTPMLDQNDHLVELGQRFANGEASQGQFKLIDPVGELPRTDFEYNLPAHKLVTWTEDASGDEIWLSRGRVSTYDGGRGFPVGGDQVEYDAIVDDGNVELRGQAFTEVWVRPEETGHARLVALQAYTLNGATSTNPTARATCEVSFADAHLAPNTNTETMPAKTYPVGTQPQGVVTECADTEGKVYGVVIHHDGGSHLCLQYIAETDHTTYASPIKISDKIADWDPTDLTAPVFEPHWEMGKASVYDGQELVSGLVSTWGTDQVVFSEHVPNITEYDRWIDHFSDSESEDVAQATQINEAERTYRQLTHVTHRVSIIMLPEQLHLVTAGMSLQIKATAAIAGQYLGTYQTRRVAEHSFRPRSDGRYWADLNLDRVVRRRAYRRGAGGVTVPQLCHDGGPCGAGNVDEIAGESWQVSSNGTHSITPAYTMVAAPDEVAAANWLDLSEWDGNEVDFRAKISTTHAGVHGDSQGSALIIGQSDDPAFGAHGPNYVPATTFKWQVTRDAGGAVRVQVHATNDVFGDISGDVITVSAGEPFWIRGNLTASEINMRAWRTDESEPGSWQATASGPPATDLLAIMADNDVFAQTKMFDDESEFKLYSLEIASGYECPSCIHGGPNAASTDDTDAAPAGHQHDYLAAGGTAGQVALKSSATDWETGWAYIEQIATAETDDALVLAPDGAGGVEFRAETGGDSPWEEVTPDEVWRLKDDVYVLSSSDDSVYMWWGAAGTPVASGFFKLFALGGIDLNANDGTPGGGSTDKHYLIGGHGLVVPILSADPSGGNSENGQVYYNDTTDKFRAYQNGAWVDVIGGGGAGMAGELVTDTIIGDGATDTFALSVAPTGTWALVSTNGADLLPSEFAIVASDVVFDVAPANLAEVLVTFITGGFTVPATDPGDIADPTLATAEDVALKLNALMANLRTAGIIA